MYVQNYKEEHALTKWQSRGDRTKVESGWHCEVQSKIPLESGRPTHLLYLTYLSFLFKWLKHCRNLLVLRHHELVFHHSYFNIAPTLFTSVIFVLRCFLLKAGLGFVWTNVWIRWNSVYKSISSSWSFWKRLNWSLLIQTGCWHGKHAASTRAGLWKANAER